jgi:hypothetical protein
MKIKSFGCSFIFGTDIGDEQAIPKLPIIPSKKTWPALIAQRFNSSYDCYARPGSGNLQIAERVLSHLADEQPTFFVIGWTWIDRFDYTNCTISNEPIQSKWENWRTLMPIDNSELAKTYYKGLHSEFRDKLCSLINIKLVIDQLKATNTKFVMTYMDDLLFDDQWHVNQAIRDLQASIRPYMTTFNKKTFLEFSKQNGYPISDTLHPLELAHQSAANYMLTVFDKQNTNDPIQPAHV